jgi:hypothetical protein
LFEHVALRRSLSAIAAKDLNDGALGTSIYNRIKPYAAQLRIQLSDGNTNRFGRRSTV